MSEFNIRERSDKVDIYDEKIIIQYWEKLLNYKLSNYGEIGKPLTKYNGAVRVDISRIESPKLIKNPQKHLNVLNLFRREANILPSYGLKIKRGSKYDYVHYLLELNEYASVGIFFYDNKRLLSVPQIHNIERMIESADLKGGIVIANLIGIPAKQEAKRINDDHGGHGIITIEHYDSIKKRLEGYMI